MANDDMTGTYDTTGTPPLPLRVFAVTAMVEAITWAGLLVGIVLKRVLEVTDVGVQVFGSLHGAAFIAYVISTLLVWRIQRRASRPDQRWTVVTGLLALAASLPPFGTVVFHRWAQRTGRLVPPAPVGTSAARPSLAS